MEKVLYVTKHNPWGIGGGAVASKMYLKALSDVFREYTIDLCIADTITSDSYQSFQKDYPNVNILRVSERRFLSKLFSPITFVTHRYQTFGKKLLKHNKYKYCVFDHSSISGTLITEVPIETKTITIHHNFEPDYFIDNNPNWIRQSMLLPAVSSCERLAFKNSTYNIFLTQEDKEQFYKTYGQSKGKCLVTGLFELNSDKFTVKNNDLNIKPITIVITGSLNNVQNIDGIQYFIQDLYPLIPINLQIIIAGRNPPKEIKDMVEDKSNISLIPNPQNMNDIIDRGSIFLSPARLGSGIKVRITDGLKRGLPVIAHKVSSRGYEAFINEGFFKVFETPEEFKDRLLEVIDLILNGKVSTEKIGEFYRDTFSFSKIVENMRKSILSD